MIIPARWFSGGRDNQLGQFRADMLNNTSLQQLVVYAQSNELFPTVEIKSGVCYYLINRGYSGACNYTLHDKGNTETVLRELNEFDILIRDIKLSSIVKKVLSATAPDAPMVSSLISNDTPFGISTNVRTSTKRTIELYDSATANHSTALYHIEKGKRKIEYIDGSIINKNTEYINTPKVFIPSAGGSGDDPIVLGRPICAPANSVCSQSFLFAAFNSQEEAENFTSYLKTRFFRILVSAVKISQGASNRTYRFVPLQDFSHPWTDEMLYEKYNISEEEIAYIESKINLMD